MTDDQAKETLRICEAIGRVALRLQDLYDLRVQPDWEDVLELEATYLAELRTLKAELDGQK